MPIPNAVDSTIIRQKDQGQDSRDHHIVYPAGAFAQLSSSHTVFRLGD